MGHQAKDFAKNQLVVAMLGPSYPFWQAKSWICCIYVYAHIYNMYIHACMHTYIHTCIYIICISVSVCVWVSECECNVIRMYIYIYLLTILHNYLYTPIIQREIKRKRYLSWPLFLGLEAIATIITSTCPVHGCWSHPAQQKKHSPIHRT